MKDAPSFGRIFFHFMPMGLYSIKDDEQNLFYQPVKFYASMDYHLLAQEDVDLSPPEIDNISQIKFAEKIINDSDIITDVMNLYNKTVEYETGTPILPALCHKIKVYSKLYSGVYYCIEIWQTENSSDYWIVLENREYIKVPSELIDKLI